MQIYKNHRGITTVNKHLPFVWRVNYLHEAPLPETVPRSRTKRPVKFCRKTFLGRAQQRS